MSNLNKTYHKGKYRSHEWAKHLRPYLKRLGNKRFRKVMSTLEEAEYEKYIKTKSKKGKNKIRVKITFQYNNCGKQYSYYRNYKTMKGLNSAVRRTNVLRYLILNKFDNLEG